MEIKMQYNVIGLPVRHPRYGYGIIKKVDKFGRYGVKFLTGTEIGALSESNLELVPMREMTEERVGDRFERAGIYSFYDKNVYAKFMSGCNIVTKLKPFLESGGSLNDLKGRVMKILSPDKIGHIDVISSIDRRSSTFDLFGYLYKLEVNLRNDLKELNNLLEEISCKL
jgi:hypothetical protein